jgi:hypothetical protein
LAVTDDPTYTLARQQGYDVPEAHERRSSAAVAGLGSPVDLVILAR